MAVELNLTADKIYDMTVRHALFVEGLKVNMYKEAQAELDNLEKNLVVFFAKNKKFAELPSLTKRGLNELIVSLQELQYRAYGTIAHRVLKLVNEYVSVERTMLLQAWTSSATNTNEEDEEYNVEIKDDDEALALILLFAKENGIEPYILASVLATSVLLGNAIINTPIAATGYTIKQALEGLSSAAAANIEVVLRQAHANKVTTDELIQLFVGKPTPGTLAGIGKQNIIDKLGRHLEGVTDAITQHINQQATAAVVSNIGKSYRWISIIDSVTTAVCRERNGMIYVFGEGPLPPAHYNCRSTIEILIDGVAQSKAPTFKEWLKTQPDDVKSEFGRHYDKTTGKFMPERLTADEFKYKLEIITK